MKPFTSSKNQKFPIKLEKNNENSTNWKRKIYKSYIKKKKTQKFAYAKII